MYDLWSLLFANFRQDVPVDAGRTWLYEIIHFPLHFSMLLLLLAMVNPISINSFAFGIVDLLNKFELTLNYVLDGVPIESHAVQRLAVEMNRLDTTPDFEAEYALMQGMVNGTITSNAALEAYTYFAQLLYAACQKSSVVVGGEADDLLTQLYQIDQNATAPGFDIERQIDNAETLATQAITSILRTALTGTLWLYPAAGITLILCALRSMTRYHFKGATHWVVHGLQLGFGTALALLGMLAIGSSAADVDQDTYDIDVHRPMYEVVLAKMGLAIVFIAYTCVVLGSSVRRGDCECADGSSGSRRSNARASGENGGSERSGRRPNARNAKKRKSTLRSDRMYPGLLGNRGNARPSPAVRALCPLSSRPRDLGIQSPHKLPRLLSLAGSHHGSDQKSSASPTAIDVSGLRQSCDVVSRQF